MPPLGELEANVWQCLSGLLQCCNLSKRTDPKRHYWQLCTAVLAQTAGAVDSAWRVTCSGGNDDTKYHASFTGHAI